MPEPLSVSIIIPTKNRPVDLCRVCRSVWQQTVCARQLIIVDQSPEHESKEAVARQYADEPRVVRETLKLDYVRDTTISGLVVARNRAMEIAFGDIWLFLDDDVILEPDFLQQLLGAYASHPEAVGISGVVTNYTRPPRLSRLWNTIFLRGPFFDDRQPVYWQADRLRNSGPVRVSRLGGGLMSFRSEAIRGKKFDENLRGVSDGEDADFCAHLGTEALLLITPKARLVHNQSPSGRERAHWLARHARGLTYLYRRNWRHGVKNRLCFMWLNVGYALTATLAGLRRASLEPWRSLLAGLREGAHAAGPARPGVPYPTPAAPRLKSAKRPS